MNERLRVMLLVNDLRIGGAERQLVELAKGLDRQRFYPIVATLYGGQPLERELAGRDDLRLVCLDRRHKYDFTTTLKLARLLRRERVQIIQPFLTPATFFGLTASLLARTPVKVVTERCGTRLSTHLANRLYRAVEDRLTAFADAAIPNSEAGRRYLIGRGVRPEKISVVYNGVNPDRTLVSPEDRAAVSRSLSLPPEARVVGIVASLQAAKDHDTFLRAAARVVRELPDTHFVIAGDGPLRPALEALARELGLASRVLFVGNQVRVAPLIDRFDVAALSSCDHEGCSNFLLEAMALAKPAVCTDVGGNTELIAHGQNGFVAPVKAPEELAARMLAILNDPGGARAMGQESRRRFEARFTLERMVRDYEELYLKLWDGRVHGVRAGRRESRSERQAEVAK